MTYPLTSGAFEPAGVAPPPVEFTPIVVATYAVWAVVSVAATLLIYFRAHPNAVRLRRWVEQRWNVQITSGAKGYWRVHGRRSAVSRSFISTLQFWYWLAVYALWAGVVLVGFGLVELTT